MVGEEVAVEEVGEEDYGHSDYIDARLVLNGIRRKLNTMEPWKHELMGEKVFEEKVGGGMAKYSDQATRKLNRLMQESLSEFE